MPDQPLSHGYSIEGLTEPGQFDNEPAFPGINLNENMELAFKNVFNDMIDHFEKAQSEAAEALAHQLISWARLPILYRVYSHVVSTLPSLSLNCLAPDPLHASSLSLPFPLVASLVPQLFSLLDYQGLS